MSVSQNLAKDLTVKIIVDKYSYILKRDARHRIYWVAGQIPPSIKLSLFSTTGQEKAGKL